MIDTVFKFFQDGGAFMFPIAIVLALGLAIAVERWIYLTRARVSNLLRWRKLQPMLEKGELRSALNTSSGSNSAIDKILTYGLSRAANSTSSAEVEMAMEEGLMEVMPRLEKRTHYLATLANIATLLGLLGTIIGLIKAFTAVGEANPADKADLLSASISVAMNTTAFGLMAGIPLLLLHALLTTKTTTVVDSLEMATVRIMNMITGHSAKTKQQQQ